MILTKSFLRTGVTLLLKERLRLGTVNLIRQLQQEDFEAWVYTSSFRTERYIRTLFRHYGVRFDGIVNGERHQKEVQAKSKELMPTKMPNRYRITLHVDDEASVATYGRTYGFRVFQLDARDDDRGAKIMSQVRKIREVGHPADNPAEE